MKVKLFPTYVCAYICTFILLSPSPFPSLPLSPLPLPLFIFFSVQVWDSFGRNLYSSQLHESPIASLAWSPDGVCACACVYVRMYVCTCKHLYVHTIRVCLYVRTSVCLCVCVFMYVRRSLRVVYEVSTHACHAVQSHNPQTIGLKYHNAPNTTTHLVFLNCCL